MTPSVVITDRQQDYRTDPATTYRGPVLESFDNLFPFLMTDAERAMFDLRCELITDQDGTDTSTAASIELTDLY